LITNLSSFSEKEPFNTDNSVVVRSRLTEAPGRPRKSVPSQPTSLLAKKWRTTGLSHRQGQSNAGGAQSYRYCLIRTRRSLPARTQRWEARFDSVQDGSLLSFGPSRRPGGDSGRISTVSSETPSGSSVGFVRTKLHHSCDSSQLMLRISASGDSMEGATFGTQGLFIRFCS